MEQQVVSWVALPGVLLGLLLTLSIYGLPFGIPILYCCARLIGALRSYGKTFTWPVKTRRWLLTTSVVTSIGLVFVILAIEASDRRDFGAHVMGATILGLWTVLVVYSTVRLWRTGAVESIGQLSM